MPDNDPTFLTGIELHDSTPFLDWANSILPWLNGAMLDVARGTEGDIPALVEKQDRYTAYQGICVELYSKAQAYYKDALARAMEEYLGKVPPSLVARVAEQKCVNESMVFDAIHRLNSTLSDQLIAIAARLKFEGKINPTNPVTRTPF